MKLRINNDAIAAVIAADCRGEPPTVMKPLYVARNTIGVDLDSPIYRIVPIEYILEDISRARFTHTRISPKTWGDPAENPLLKRAFRDPQTGRKLRLNGVVENIFGSCWSLTALDDIYDWATFSHGKPSIRIESTPGLLLSAAMHLANPYYSLHHAIGKVSYLTTQELEAYFDDPNYAKHLDTLGQGIFIALMGLGTDFKGENEVRIMCNYMPSEPWVQQHFEYEKDLLRIPFEWADTIRSVAVGPLVGAGGQKGIEQELQQLGVICPVTSSPTRSHSG